MQTIIVGTPGPQGSKGDQGIQGPSGSLQASNSGSFSITGSLTVSGSSTLTNIGPAVFSGSLDVTQGITGSLFGTASLAVVAQTASFVSGSNVVGSVSSASNATNATNATNADKIYVDGGSTTSINVIPTYQADGSTDGYKNLQLSANPINYYYKTTNLVNNVSGQADLLYLGGGGNSAGAIFLNSTIGLPSYLYSDGPLHLFSQGYKVQISSSADGIELLGNTEVTGSLTVHTEGNSTQATSVIYAGTGSLALVPSGSGAIVASIPDGTAVGGNARGDYAVDLQRFRTGGTDVAGGDYSIIVGGKQNEALGDGSVSIGTGNQANTNNSFAFGRSNNSSGGDSVAIGYNCSASGFSSISIGRESSASNSRSIAIGDSCISSGNRSVSIGLSNTASSNYSTVSGGESNTASTGTHATVVGGTSNTSSGQYSTSGGYSNVASGQGAVALGYDNTVSADRSVVVGANSNSTGTYAATIGQGSSSQGNFSGAFGKSVTAYNQGSIAIGYYSQTHANYSVSTGNNCLAYGQYSHARGFRPETRLYGQDSFASGYFTSNGDAQKSSLVARKEDTLTTGATTILSLDGTGTTNLITPDGNNRAWNVTVEYVGVCTAAGSGTTAVGDVVTGTDKFRFKRVSGTSTIGSVTNIELTQDASMTSAECTYAVGGSNDLQISFAAPTTANSTTFRVVAKVSLVEVAW